MKVYIESRRRFPGWYKRLVGRLGRAFRRYGFSRVRYRKRRF